MVEECGILLFSERLLVAMILANAIVKGMVKWLFNIVSRFCVSIKFVCLITSWNSLKQISHHCELFKNTYIRYVETMMKGIKNEILELHFDLVLASLKLIYL